MPDEPEEETLSSDGVFKRWKAKPRSGKCKRCGCMQRMTHQHYRLDADDPQWSGHAE